MPKSKKPKTSASKPFHFKKTTHDWLKQALERDVPAIFADNKFPLTKRDTGETVYYYRCPVCTVPMSQDLIPNHICKGDSPMTDNIIPATKNTQNIMPFNFEGSDIQIIDQKGNYWFIANEVCKVLGIANSYDAVSRLDDDEKSALGITDPHGREQKTNIINESGLYSLILTSRKPQAKRFKKWITSQVIPSIRKTGSYGQPNAEQFFNNPDNILMLATNYKKVSDERDTLVIKTQQLEHKIEADKGLVGVAKRIEESVGEQCIRDTLKSLGYPPNTATRWLVDAHHLYRNAKGALMGYQRDVDTGRFCIRPVPRGDKVFTQTLVTCKGMVWFEKILPPLAFFKQLSTIH